MFGSILLWLSFPPVGYWPLAWLALLPWMLLVSARQVGGRRPWLKIWLAGWGYWAATLYFIPIPHWALWFGWIALSLYLSVYPVAFIWLSRVMVHEHRVPLVLAAPIVFTAMEWLRAHLLGGFGLLMLANSQYQSPLILQICGIFGGYGLTFLMVMVTATVCEAGFRTGLARLLWIPVTGLVLVACLVYGSLQLKTADNGPDTNGQGWRFTIVQGSVDTRFPATEQEQRQYEQDQFDHYAELQRRVMLELNDQPPVAVLWPEGKFPIPDVNPPGVDDKFAELRQRFRYFHQVLTESRVPYFLAGCSTLNPFTNERFNSALLIDQEGQVVKRYYKNHLVMFGEFIPLASWFPRLAMMTPIGMGLSVGTGPAAMIIPTGETGSGDVILSPFICFESTITHLIRRHVNQLAEQQLEPDILVNLTDDGWFYGTALLDHHLACNVLRAVENGKPVVVAANTGFSANIDAYGRLIDVGPRRQTAILHFQVNAPRKLSLYRKIGQWPAVGLAILCGLAVILKWFKRKSPVETTADDTAVAT